MLRVIALFLLLVPTVHAQPIFAMNPTDSICRGTVDIDLLKINQTGHWFLDTETINFLYGGIPPTTATLSGVLDVIGWTGSPTSVYVPVSTDSPQALVDCRVCICTPTIITMSCAGEPGRTIRCTDDFIQGADHLIQNVHFKAVAK